jgi:RNA polymerase sigma-70 factor (ECF subfamily)
VQPEDQLIQRVREGNREATAELIERYRRMGMTLAVKMLRSEQDAEEALQDGFVRAIRSIKSFDNRSKFATWFYRIVYNVCLSRLRQKGEKYVVSIDDEDVHTDRAIMSYETPERMFEENEMQEVVAQELDKLSPHYRTVLTLFVQQELSYQEIAEVTGMPLGTVKTNLFRARAILKERLEKHYAYSKEQV